MKLASYAIMYICTRLHHLASVFKQKNYTTVSHDPAERLPPLGGQIHHDPQEQKGPVIAAGP